MEATDSPFAGFVYTLVQVERNKKLEFMPEIENCEERLLFLSGYRFSCSRVLAREFFPAGDGLHQRSIYPQPSGAKRVRGNQRSPSPSTPKPVHGTIA